MKTLNELYSEVNSFDEKLNGLNRITPHFENPQDEIDVLNKLKNLLINDKYNKMLLTEYNFFSLLLNENLNGPSRTYDNISYPNKNSKIDTVLKNLLASTMPDIIIPTVVMIAIVEHNKRRDLIMFSTLSLALNEKSTLR